MNFLILKSWIIKGFKEHPLQSIFNILIIVFSLWSCQISNENNNLAKEANDTAKRANIYSKKANGLSINAISIAEESNKIAKDATEISQRPYLSVKPIKFGEPKEYLNFTETETTIIITIELEIKNLGQSLAKNISAPQNYIFNGKNIEKNLDPNCLMPEKMDLAPGDNFFVTVGLETNKIQSAKVIKLLTIDNKGLQLRVPIHYENDFRPYKTYTKTVGVKIFKNMVQILDESTATSETVTALKK